MKTITVSESYFAQAAQVLRVHAELTEIDSDSGPCLFQMVVQFNTDTSVPVVEIQEGLDSLLTFAPASLAKTPHHGYWRDYRTLVILFTECAQWERDERKPLYLVFYGSEGNAYISFVPSVFKVDSVIT